MNKDLTRGAPQSVLWRFCLPLFGSVIFQQLYNIADSWVAGRFIGEQALAAVSNSYEITLIYLAIAFGCNIGCSVITSRYFGAKDMDRVKTTVSTAFIASLTACITLMLIGLIGGGLLLRLMRTPEGTLMADSLLYLRIYTLGLPFVFFYNLSTGIFTALGDSRTPFWFLSVSSVVNIGMDILFVQGLGMRVEGVAWATLICQGVSCVLSVLIVLKRLRSLKAGRQVKLFDRVIFRQFLGIAVPSALQQSFISIGNIILQGVINNFKDAVMAGYGAGVKLNNLVITSFTTLGNGISNYTSQNIGADKPERVHPGFKAGLKMVTILSVVLGSLYFIFPEALLRFFIQDPTEEAIRSGVLFLRILSPFYIVVSCKLISDGVLRGAGKMKQFMIGTFTDLVLRVALAILLSSTALGWVGIWCAWPIGWILGTGLSLIYYRQSGWHRGLDTKETAG